MQLVVFALASQAYGVEISAVREIIRMQAITALPQSPEYMEGVIDLRGSVVPVMDLRKLLNLDIDEETADSRILVTETRGRVLGMVVDAVEEVMRVANEDVEPPLGSIIGDGGRFILGIARKEGRLITLLDLDELISAT